MKSIKYILAISFLLLFSAPYGKACGPCSPAPPGALQIFRSCSPELERQWQEGRRFQEYEKSENCLLWQNLTSKNIPLRDIEEVIYKVSLPDLRKMSPELISGNRFAKWLSYPDNIDDLEYILIAKEIEGIRDYMNDPWYYAYDGDDEHRRLGELLTTCREYKGRRHADRYALQLMRLLFANKNFECCIKLWETSACKMPRNIVTDMIASYAGGAYARKDKRNKAIELYTLSGDIGSLINLKAWDNEENDSEYTDSRIKEMEYIFNRFPNSPLLSIKLQEHVRARESFVIYYADWERRNFKDPVSVKTYWDGDSLVADDERPFYNELKQFAHIAISSSSCKQKGMWQYAMAYLYYLDGDNKMTSYWLSRAEKAEANDLIKNSIRTLRFLVDAEKADNSPAYLANLYDSMQWLDKNLQEEVELNTEQRWQYSNKMNWSICYWQDVVRRILLGEVCPRVASTGNMTLALQLANYASNRIYQIAPFYKASYYGVDEKGNPEIYSSVLTMNDYRAGWPGNNYFDYQSQFFELINGCTALQAAAYAESIHTPKSKLSKFLNERGYVDSDYIFEIVGTLCLREMNYTEAVKWLSKVSTGYHDRTNLAKEGCFKLDPFQYQFDKKHVLPDQSDYKLKFALKMAELEKMMESECEPNRKANAKIRYAIGLRNSFGQCWSLTSYAYNMIYGSGKEPSERKWYTSVDREGFNDNSFAQKAYERVDALIAEALAEFTESEQAAQAQLEMLNFATLMAQYPDSKAAAQIRSRCDNYYDYALQAK